MKTYPELTNRQKSIIIGTTFGDGNLAFRNSGATNVEMSLVHGHRQRPYLEWKRSELSPIFTSKTVRCEYPPHKFQNRIISGGVSYRSRSRSHPFLTDTFHKMYPSGIKVVSKELLYSLDPLAIAVWYMDDGCLSSPYVHLYNVILCTNSFSESENTIMAEYFQSVHQIHFGLRHQHGTTMLASTDKQSIVRFVNLVKEHILPMFFYKVAIDYRS